MLTCHAGRVEDGLVTELQLPSPVVEIDDDRCAAAGVRVLLKRDDLIHPEVPGNKWRKLKYNIATARELGFENLLTFGGAYSNHIRATAAVGAYFGFGSVGVIRGEEHLPLNPSLRFAVSRSMQLTYLDRTTYRASVCVDLLCRVSVHSPVFMSRRRPKPIHRPFMLSPSGAMIN